VEHTKKISIQIHKFSSLRHATRDAIILMQSTPLNCDILHVILPYLLRSNTRKF